MFKNVASTFIVFAFDATTNVPKTGDAANITAYVSKDYGTVTVLADTSATEMDATNAPGYYLFDAAQGETNGDCLMVSAKSATANIKVIGAPAVIYTRPTTGWLAPTTAGRTLDVTATGGAGIDWSNVEAPTTTLALTGTTIATTQKVDVETIKTNPVVNAGTVTFPTTATLASTTNIAAGTITTTTNLTNLPTIPANWLTAAGTAADFGAEMATAIWTDATAGDFTVAASVGKSIMNGVALGTGLTINAYTGNTAQTGDSFARIGATGSGLTSLASQASIAALNNLSAAQVNAEVVDVLTVDTIPELVQGVTAVTPTFSKALMLFYMALRNKLDVDANFKEIHNDAGTVITKKALSDAAGVYSEAKAESGP